MSTKKRGGAREGAGRKPVDNPRRARVMVNLTATEEGYLEAKRGATPRGVYLRNCFLDTLGMPECKENE